MTINSDKVARWHRWLDAIENDLMLVFRQKEVYDEFVRVHNAHLDQITAADGETFCRSVRTWYGIFARKYLGLFNRGYVSLLPPGGRAISIPLAVNRDPARKGEGE